MNNFQLISSSIIFFSLLHNIDDSACFSYFINSWLISNSCLLKVSRTILHPLPCHNEILSNSLKIPRVPSELVVTVQMPTKGHIGNTSRYGGFGGDWDMPGGPVEVSSAKFWNVDRL